VKLSDLLKEAPGGALGPATIESLTGRATLEVVSAVTAVSKTGSDMVKMKLRSIDGTAKGRTLFDYIVFSENPDALPFLVEKMGALGLLKKELLEADDLEIVARAAVGRRAIVDLIGDNYNGRISAKVRSWIEPAGSADAVANVKAETPAWLGDDTEEPF